MDGKVIMLTGAAGTGKSTLARECSARIRPLQRVDFGQLLLERIQKTHSGVTYDQLRSQSSAIITAEDVRETDAALIQSLPKLRTQTHILIDSHSVNRERYGYRVTHYSFDNLRRIAFDAILITFCEPDIWVERRAKDPQGRPNLSRFEVQHFMALQEAVGIQYAIACGCPCYLLDTGLGTPLELVDDVRKFIRGIGGLIA